MSDYVSSEDQSRVIERLRQFFLWDVLVCIVAGLAMVALYAFFPTPFFLIMFFEIMLFIGLLIVARELMERSHLDAAISVLAIGLWIITASIAIAAPVAIPVALLLLVLSVMVALPIVSGGALLRLIVGAALLSGLITGFQLSDGFFDLSIIPDWSVAAILVVAVPVTAGLIFLLLWQYSRRLTETLSRTRETNLQLHSEVGERRRAETKLQDTLDELRQTQQQAVQHERMRALGQMASGIAHDFNNALSPIVSFSAMLLDSPESLDDKKQVTEDLGIINIAARDAATVVKRLRDFYRDPDLNEIVTDVAVNDIVKESVSLTQPRWKAQAQSEGLTITVETKLGEVTNVPGNPAELREALTNLIINASDALKENGTIELSTWAEDAFVAIEVRDTGIGMPPEVVELCMDPFYSTKGERGTGMGLAMVYGIVQRHRGTIDVKSTVGVGTTFVMRFPRERDTVGTTRPPREPGLSKGQHVLVVDDDPLGRAVLSRLLESDGHSLELAENGREGLDKLRAGKYDLLITDRAMPGMNGDQLAEAVKQYAPDTPIVMVTGFGDIMAGSAEQPAHIDAVVPKPIDRDELRRAIASVTVAS